LANLEFSKIAASTKSSSLPPRQRH